MATKSLSQKNMIKASGQEELAQQNLLSNRRISVAKFAGAPRLKIVKMDR